MLAVNDLFSSIEKARDAINRHVLDEGQSYRMYKSDCRRYIIICKDPVCKFRIRASLRKKKGVVITILIPYSCSPASHYNPLLCGSSNTIIKPLLSTTQP
jgi:hypothetical protein